jgi:hypothetical protein
MNRYQDLQFKLGFFASTRVTPPLANTGWRTWQAGDLAVSYDPELPFAVATSGASTVAILGRIVSLDLATTVAEEIAAVLAGKLAESEDSFHAAMDACCGRYMCLFATGEDVRVVGDATGMKMVCYATEPLAVASHATLLAETLAKPESPEMAEFAAQAIVRGYNMTFLPGHATAYRDVRSLVPNTSLSLRTGEVQRVFPRAPNPVLAYEQALDQVTRDLRDLASKFLTLGPLTISLTAGLDSRLTAAAFSSFADRVTFFTYVRRGELVNAVDAAIAKRVAAANHLQHREYFFKHELAPSDEIYADYLEFAEVARRNTRFEHFYSLAYTYVTSFPRGHLHVRSNMGEICRARYHTDPFDGILRADDSELEKLVKIYCTWTKAKPHDIAYREFGRYLDETHLLSTAHGFDLYALYYWELLMPVWHGSLLLESDLAHDTICLFNSRRLLATYLAMPFDKQLSAAGMLDSIERLCPGMLAEPINPEPTQLPDSELAPYLNSRPPIAVAAHPRPDKTIHATITLAEGQLAGALEYAFYLFKDGTRIAEHWYGPRSEVVFAVPESTEHDQLDVTGFAREVANPQRKLSKRVRVLRRI